MSTSRCGPAEVLAADLDVASRQLELLSIVSLGADWFQNGRQGSPTRSLPNASLSLSEAADRLGGWQHKVVRRSPKQSARRLHTEWGTTIPSPLPFAKNYGIDAHMRGFRTERHTSA